MFKHRLLPFLVTLLVTVSCGKANNSAKNDAIQNMLRNGQFPSRTAVKNNTISQEDFCENFISTLPDNYFHEIISVPENPVDADGRKIKIFYYGRIIPGKTPAVFFNGGPTSDSHGSFKVLSDELTKRSLKNEIGIIYIDQRGTGCSDPFPTGQDEETLQRLRHYGSRGIVADAEAIRKKLLGDSKWIAYGQSYGAFINHRYAIVAPESLEAASSHANVITPNGMDRAVNRIRSQVRVLREYIKAYPEDAWNLRILNQKLTNDVCFKNAAGTDQYCGYDVMSFLPSWLTFRTSWEDLHSWIKYQVQDNELDQNELKYLVDTFYFGTNRKGGNYIVDSRSAEAVINWVDRDFPQLDKKNCQSVQQALIQEGMEIRNMIGHDCATALQRDGEAVDTRAWVKHLDRDVMTVAQLRNQLSEHPELPFFLYSGELDASVPKENFISELSAIGQLPNVHYTHFMNSGHDGFLSEEKVWNDLLSVIRN